MTGATKGTPRPIIGKRAKMPPLKRLSLSKIDELMRTWQTEIQVQEMIIEGAAEGDNTAEPTQRIRELGRWLDVALEEKERKIAGKKRKGAPKKKEEWQPSVGFVAPGGEIVETIYDPEDHKSQYAVYDPSTGKIAVVERFRIGEVDYKPAQDKAVAEGVVLLPTGVGDLLDTSDLVSQIEAFLHKYVDFGEERPFFATLSCYYVLLTWVYDCFAVIPYMRALGPPGVGKTRYLKTMAAMCYRATNLGGASSVAFLRRYIETYRGTTWLNEGDFRKGSDMHDQVIKVINLGYEADAMMGVMEAQKDKNWQAELFNVFSPKLIATRERFRDNAAESRCITHKFQETKRLGIALSVPPLKGWEEPRPIRNCLLRWRFEHHDSARLATPYALKAGVEARLQQLMNPMEAVMQDDPVALDNLHAFMDDYQEELRESRATEGAALVLQAMIACRENGDPLTYPNILHHFVADKKPRPQWVGRIVHDQLRLKTTRKGKIRSTVVLCDSSQLATLCDRWGVEPPENWPESAHPEQERLAL